MKFFPYIGVSVLGLGMLLCSGCSHVYKIKVDSAARADAAQKISYSIQDLTQSNLSNQEEQTRVAYVKTALSAKGMYEAPASVAPDITVIFAYDIREKKNVRDFYHNPDPAFLDDSDHVQYITVTYEKELRIVASEKNPLPGTPARVWEIIVNYEDRDPSLETAMPLLAAAGCDRIGTNTEGTIVVRLRSTDDVVAFIKQGL